MGNFKNLEVYESSKKLAVDIIKLIEKLPNKFWLKDQISKSAFSIPSNIAEAEGRSTNKHGNQFLFFALGSSFELLTQLDIISEIGLIEKSIGEDLQERTAIISRMLNKLIDYRSKHERTMDNLGNREIP